MSAALLIRSIAVGASLMLASTIASAQQVKIVGLGAAPCEQFLREIRERPQVERKYLAWAQGFMSAVLLRAPPGKDENLDLLPDGFPIDRQAEFLSKFCSASPDASFSDGVLELYLALRGTPRQRL